jgi:hypothetical protein
MTAARLMVWVLVPIDWMLRGRDYNRLNVKELPDPKNWEPCRCRFSVGVRFSLRTSRPRHHLSAARKAALRGEKRCR